MVLAGGQNATRFAAAPGGADPLQAGGGEGVVIGEDQDLRGLESEPPDRFNEALRPGDAGHRHHPVAGPQGGLGLEPRLQHPTATGEAGPPEAVAAQARRQVPAPLLFGPGHHHGVGVGGRGEGLA